MGYNVSIMEREWIMYGRSAVVRQPRAFALFVGISIRGAVGDRKKRQEKQGR